MKLIFSCIEILRRTDEESGSRISFLLTKLERRQSSGGLVSFFFFISSCRTCVAARQPKKENEVSRPPDSRRGLSVQFRYTHTHREKRSKEEEEEGGSV